MGQVRARIFADDDKSRLGFFSVAIIFFASCLYRLSSFTAAGVLCILFSQTLSPAVLGRVVEEVFWGLVFLAFLTTFYFSCRRRIIIIID